jgi:cAMP-dependent protein kinase regulator
MGCGQSRAVPVATGDDTDSLTKHRDDGHHVPGQQHDHADPRGATVKEAAPQPARSTSISSGSPSASSSSAAAATRSPAAAKLAGDAQVAVALKAKRGGILVEGTSVQVDPNYQKKVVPKSPAAREMIKSALTGNALFAALGDGVLADIIDALEQRSVTAGTTVITQGEPGDYFYVIESGKVRRGAGRARARGGKPAKSRECCVTPFIPPPLPLPPAQLDIVVGGRKVADWGEGTPNRTVGDLALWYNAPRAATVVAVTDSRLWCIDRATFRNVTAQSAYASHQALKASLRKGALEELSDAQLDRLADAAQRTKFGKGDHIIKKGSEGEVFYIIETGSVICKNLPGEQVHNVLHEGDYFGERALLKREPRVCDVYAETDVTLIAVAREDFESLLGHLRDLLEHNLGMRLLLCVPILAELSDAARSALFSTIRLVSYTAGQAIVTRGAPVSHFFIIKEGAVAVSAPADADTAGLKVLAKVSPPSSSVAADAEGVRQLGVLNAGQWFGESEIESGEPAPVAYTAGSAGAVQCFVVDRQTYVDVLAKYISRKGASRSGAAEGKSAGSSSSSSSSGADAHREGKRGSDGGRGGGGASAPAGGPAGGDLTLRSPDHHHHHRGRGGDGRPVEERGPRPRLGLPFKELEHKATLGTGTFGRVRLVFHRKTNRVFALKMLKKSQIVALRQEKNIMNEKDILMRVDHPFIIKLWDTYKVRGGGERADGGCASASASLLSTHAPALGAAVSFTTPPTTALSPLSHPRPSPFPPP